MTPSFLRHPRLNTRGLSTVSATMLVLVMLAAGLTVTDVGEPSLANVTVNVVVDHANPQFVGVSLVWSGPQSGFRCIRYQETPRMEYSHGTLDSVDLQPPTWVGRFLKDTRRCWNQATFRFTSSDANAVLHTLTIWPKSGPPAVIQWRRADATCSLVDASGAPVSRLARGDAVVVRCPEPWHFPTPTYPTPRFVQGTALNSVGFIGHLGARGWSFTAPYDWDGEGELAVQATLHQTPAQCDGFRACIVRHDVRPARHATVGARPWQLSTTGDATARLVPQWRVQDAAVELTARRGGRAMARAVLAVPSDVVGTVTVRFTYELTGDGRLHIHGGTPLESIAAPGRKTVALCAKPGDNIVALTLEGGIAPTVATLAHFEVVRESLCQ